MTDPRIDLRSPWIAGVLAFLIPGAGHLYQGRIFKGVLYMVCIVGTFSYGLALAEGHVVYKPRQASTQNYYGYYAQAMVGLPSLPALVQTRRYDPVDESLGSEPEKRAVLDEAIDADFTGRISYLAGDGRQVGGEATGRVTLEPVRAGSREVRGRFVGKLADGSEVEVALEGPIVVGPRIFASEDVGYRRLNAEGAPLDPHDREPVAFSSGLRYLSATIVDPATDRPLGQIEGRIPRSVMDWFAVPPTEAALNDYNFRLGKVLELAFVCTWIAGLLNLLAIWDAVEGPAYGYGDGSEDEEPKSAGDPKSDPAESPKPVAVDLPPSP